MPGKGRVLRKILENEGCYDVEEVELLTERAKIHGRDKEEAQCWKILSGKTNLCINLKN